MSYVKGQVIPVADYTALGGVSTQPAADSTAATAVAGYLWGTGFGDRGYGEFTSIIQPLSVRQVLTSTQWTTLRTEISNLCSWQNTASTLLPPAGAFAKDAVIVAHNSASPSNNTYDLPALLALLDTNRFNYQLGNMTLVTTATSTTRGTTWGFGGSITITAEFSVTFTTEAAARAFFNTGGEIRVELSHPNTSTSRNSSWNTVLSGFSAAFRANATALIGGSYGTPAAVGYYGLTTSYQTIVDGSNTGISPYGVNDFLVEAKAATITGSNGAKGSVLNFRVTLVDQQTNAFSDVVNSGTVAAISHLRATGGVITAKAAPTCAVVTAF